ncbi:immunodominant staphylococcal antigen IsaB family protein [Mammaliicoccus sciuri]|uniref:immunodominant staphylococcal antigen IsaB family protein n=1 Tax=Mammaliicoccus sciuri TaxID=1296 RepID=UPI000D1F3BA4|nr:hypothetical protein [Mammaliicoccus sciuri]PTK01276.1 hypothetical protein BUZ87_08855 [Mammaliicoccus sciuri]
MRKVSKVLSATVVLSTLVVGSSAVPITGSSSDVQAAEKVQEWGHGEGGSGVSTESTADTQSQIPWYNYEGYTTYDPTFTLDYNFVRAMKYDNFTLNGYKANPKANQNHAYTVDSYGSQIDFNEKDQVIQMEFNIKPHAVTKAQFKKAHASNDSTAEGKFEDGSTFIPYNTNNGAYKAYFDKDGYLTHIRIGQ